MQQLTAVAEPLVVAGPVRQIRKPGPQMGVGVADEPGLGSEPEQGLDHRERDQFGIGELRCDPHRRSFGCPFRVIDQRVVNGHVESSREGVQFRVHATVLRDQGLFKPPDRGHPRAHRRGYRTNRANPLELLV